MKINYIFIFLLLSFISFSAMKKASQHYTSEIAELDSEVEFEALELDGVMGNDYPPYFIDRVLIHGGIMLNINIKTDYQSFERGKTLSNDSSLNSIYYPHGPPLLG